MVDLDFRNWKFCSRPQLWSRDAPSWCVRMHFSLHSSEASSMNHTQLNFELIWSTTLFNSESQNLRLGKNLSLSCNSHNESNHIAQSLTRFESVSIKLWNEFPTDFTEMESNIFLWIRIFKKLIHHDNIWNIHSNLSSGRSWLPVVSACVLIRALHCKPVLNQGFEPISNPTPSPPT